MNVLNPSRCLLLALSLAAAPVCAEKADRSKPMTLESDQPCTVSLLKQTSQCSGNVVITQGTLQIRAERLDLRETPDGYQMAQAVGTAARPASFRQKRDGADEFVEGLAQRIDYDGRTGTLRFEGGAVVRRLRGATVADEIQGALVVWDSLAEVFKVEGGDKTAANPGGRVRAVITPRPPADAASAAPAPALKATPALGERR